MLASLPWIPNVSSLHLVAKYGSGTSVVTKSTLHMIVSCYFLLGPGSGCVMSRGSCCGSTL
jgi:hypothetical protein